MTHLIPEHIEPVYPQKVPREAVREKLLELLGIAEVPETVDVTTVSMQETEEGLRLERVEYASILGEKVSGILALPVESSGESLGGVVCLPGTSGSAERLAHPRFYRENPLSGPLMGWGRELARRGFATLSLTVKGVEARRGSLARWEEEAKLLAPYGRSQMGLIVQEVLQAARALAARPRVKPERVGLAGMSLGGNATWYAMACAPWIRAAAVVCGGLGSMARVIHEGDRERHSSYYFIPHVLRYFDHGEIVSACIAPRPLMVIAPTQDEDMPSSGVEELQRIVAPVYQSAQCPERFEVWKPDTHHVFLVEYFEWVVEWFRKFLDG